MPVGYGETASAFSIVVSRHSFSILNIWYRRKTALKTVALTILLLMVALPSRENPVSANQGSQTIPFPASLLIYSIINIRMGGYDCKLRELIQIPAADILIHFNNASALLNACHCTERVVPFISLVIPGLSVQTTKHYFCNTTLGYLFKVGKKTIPPEDWSSLCDVRVFLRHRFTSLLSLVIPITSLLHFSNVSRNYSLSRSLLWPVFS